MTSKDLLRRYTKLPFLLDILQKNKLFFRNPVSWEDKNDAYFLETYKKRRGLKTLLALCFAETSETYLHWKIYSGDESGVCIEFNKEKLLSKVQGAKGFTAREVNYPTFDRLRETSLSVKDLPFIKRYAYIGEREFRFIYESNKKNSGNVNISIEPNDVEMIIVSPWVNMTVFKSIETTIRKIKGWEEVPIRKSTITENEEWQRIADNAL
jgi:hypothetical protein